MFEGKYLGQTEVKISDIEHYFLSQNSKDVSNLKYLTCADCEIGPLGFHDPSNPKEFLIAVSRVKYEEK